MSAESYALTYNPDVLSCLANLSNDEVFTPPQLVNQILDMLPAELWHNPNATFLDPACKSGVFLREIARRLLIGLEAEIPDLQERIDHIFHRQLFGIAITELTSLLARRSLYCSKYPNGRYSISNFEDASGNIRYRRTQHLWVNGRCAFCGASESQYARGEALETHAYEFIHTTRPEELFKMKFDVIIGNPPYHLSDGGYGVSASPIYQRFVQQAIKLNPRFLILIIPSRWYSGGKGLDEFRRQMLTDRRIRRLVDYESFKDVFPGVDLAGGVCYFLWDRTYNGPCEVTNENKDHPSTMKRFLDEYEILVRQNHALTIIRRVQNANVPFASLEKRVLARKPFGLPTNYEPQKCGVPCWFIQKIGLSYAAKEDVFDTKGILNKWKFLVPKAPIAGQTDFSKPVGFYYDGNTRISSPGECCTESWIVAGAFDSEDEVKSYKSYLFTKTVRFLLLQTVVSQDVTKRNFRFIPDLVKYEIEYSDDLLRKLWNISDEEWAYIDSRISNISDGRND